MATSIIKSLRSKVQYTPILPRDTITDIYENYSVRNGSMVNIRCRFKVSAHSGGNSYINTYGTLPFGSAIYGEHGMWTDENTGESGTLVGSNNHNVWFHSNGAPISLASRVGHDIWVTIVYWEE